jgi:hypothetical protein
MKTLITFIIVLSSSLAFSQDLTFSSNPERYILGTQKDRTALISLGDIDNDGGMDAILANGMARAYFGGRLEAEVMSCDLHRRQRYQGWYSIIRTIPGRHPNTRCWVSVPLAVKTRIRRPRLPGIVRQSRSHRHYRSCSI